MSASHHGGPGEGERRSQIEQFAAIQKRFLEQMEGTARREYPAGRMGHDDDGALSYAIAADPTKQTVIIRFGKPVEWIGLGIVEANELLNKLREKIGEAGGVAEIRIGG
jgi:hypothetical protein